MLTEDRLRTDQRVTADRAERGGARPTTTPRGPRSWGLTLTVAWIVLFPLGMLLEPSPATNEPEPWWAAVAGFWLLMALVTTFVGLGLRRRWGVSASVVASSIFAAGVFACPTTGHHAFGLWWVGEFAASLTLLSISAAAYLRTHE